MTCAGDTSPAVRFALSGAAIAGFWFKKPPCFGFHYPYTFRRYNEMIDVFFPPRNSLTSCALAHSRKVIACSMLSPTLHSTSNSQTKLASDRRS